MVLLQMIGDSVTGSGYNDDDDDGTIPDGVLLLLLLRLVAVGPRRRHFWLRPDDFRRSTEPSVVRPENYVRLFRCDPF